MKVRKFLKRTLLWVLSVLFIGYLSMLVQVIQNKDAYAPEKSQAIIILGHSLDKNSNPSPWLIERLQLGTKLYKEGYGSYIIVTGGEGPGDKIAVAYAMEEWLLDRGVPEEIILVESDAANTYENFKNSKVIADNMGIEEVVVVTNDFHMYRSMRIAAEFFEDAGGAGAAVASGPKKVLAYLKEPLSIVKYEFQRRLTR